MSDDTSARYAHLLTEAPARRTPEREWVLRPGNPDAARRLALDLGLHPVTAQILVARGHTDAARARAFLRPDLNGILAPGDLPDIDRAVERINRALRNGEKIVIWGDYDVDGLTSTTILLNLFRFLGRDVRPDGQVRFHIPHRVEEGYGLGIPAIERFARDGVTLLVTCDCGTCDHEEIARAAELGIDVVVTDHHEPDDRLPPAHAIVNPKLPGSRYAFPGICGAGIAFKVAWAMGQSLSKATRVSDAFRDFLLDSLALVALGTVADVAPLVEENRILVAYGLIALRESLRHERSPGVRALLESVGLDPKSPVTPAHVGFRVGPRLNACGRMDHARLGVELLTGRDPDRIAEIVRHLEKVNRQRQETEKAIHAEARERVERECDLDRERVIVLAGQGWHTGVVGIVASKIVEEFHRPAILIGLRGERGRGSGRSISGFNLHQALAACRGTMIGFGGHAMAAGMEVEAGSVEHLRREINAYARDAVAESDLVPRLSIDAEVPLESLGRELARELEMLGPHGMGNPKPVLATRGLRVAGEPKLMGKSQDHLSFMVTQGTMSFKAVGFGMANRFTLAALGRQQGVRVAYSLEVNEWQGRESVELMLKDVQLES